MKGDDYVTARCVKGDYVTGRRVKGDDYVTERRVKVTIMSQNGV